MNAGLNLLEGAAGLLGLYYATLQTVIWGFLDFLAFDLLQLGWLLPIQF